MCFILRKCRISGLVEIASVHWKEDRCQLSFVFSILIFRGVDVLHKKSELKKEIERRKDYLKQQEWENYKLRKRTSFEAKLAEQANKLKLVRRQTRFIIKNQYVVIFPCLIGRSELGIIILVISLFSTHGLTFDAIHY